MQPLPIFLNVESARLAASDCVACARAQTRTQVVFGHGNPKAAIMLVGEAPSSTDDSTGKPMTGPAGRFLDRLLEEVGMHRRDLWITNLVRCFAGTERNGRIENRPVRTGELRACDSWLDIELGLINPRVVVPVGAPASKRFLGKDFSLSAQHGDAFELSSGQIVIPIVQPAFVMRLQTIEPDRFDLARVELREDLRTAGIAAGILPPRSPLP